MILNQLIQFQVSKNKYNLNKNLEKNKINLFKKNHLIYLHELIKKVVKIFQNDINMLVKLRNNRSEKNRSQNKKSILTFIIKMQIDLIKID